MKENNELTRDDIAIDHDMEVDSDEGREICVYMPARLIIWREPPDKRKAVPASRLVLPSDR